MSWLYFSGQRDLLWRGISSIGSNSRIPLSRISRAKRRALGSPFNRLTSKVVDMLFYSRFKHQKWQILLCLHEFTFHIIIFLLNCIWEGDFAESRSRDINHMHGLYKMNVPVKQLIELWIKPQNSNWAKQWFSHHKSYWRESQIKINFPLIWGSRILIATPWLGLKV